MPLGILHDRCRRVKSHRLGIEEGTGKFRWVVALEPRGRISDEREARGVTFRKAVLAEAFDLFKDSLGKLRGYSLSLHAGNQPLAMALHPSGAMPGGNVKTRTTIEPVIEPEPKPGEKEPITTEPVSEPRSEPTSQTVTLHLRGAIPPEMWNRLGTKLIPKLRSGSELKVEVGFSVSIDGQATASFESERRQILEDLGLSDKIRIERS